jgi:GT2 family glycosyltransferase
MKFTISIVSHHSAHLITNLLKDLQQHLPQEAEILLTLNCPEGEGFLAHAKDLPITVIRNPRPLGFGANHNQAFALARGELFVVVNPDIRLRAAPWQVLEDAFAQGIGACAPQVLAPSGRAEDSVRRYPSLPRLFRRVVLKQKTADYTPQSGDLFPLAVDWVAGMFVVFDANAFRRVGGFDTRYHMYFEDVDICRRLNASGYRVIWAPGTSVIHDAQRASHRSWTHRRWHLRSALRYLTGI